MSNVIPLTRPKHRIPDHELRELVNDLRDIAVKYHEHGCLRELISNRVAEALRRDRQSGLKDACAEIREHIEADGGYNFEALRREQANGETDIPSA